MLFLLFVLLVFVSWFALHISLPFLRRFLLDLPNFRSSHISPTPRGGGLVFVFIPLLFCFLQLIFGFSSFVTTIFLYTIPLVAVSIFDDFVSLSSRLRFIVHCFVSYALIFTSSFVSLIPASFPTFHVSIFLLLLAFIAIINFFNFMDGIDGLVASSSLVIFTFIAYKYSYPILAWSLIASILAFLFFNWSPASVFMGDVGSTFLGAVFASFVLHSSSALQSLSIFLCGFPILFDAFSCILLRLFNGLNIFTAHRQHFYQRLSRGGWSHSQVCLLYIFFTSVQCIFMLSELIFFQLIACLFTIAVIILLDRLVASPFSCDSTT